MPLISLYKGLFTKVSRRDYPMLSKIKWQQSKRGYVHHQYQRNYKLITVLMHRLILKAPKGVQVDHKDLDRLNNQRSNLRLATDTQQRANQRTYNALGVKGVYPVKGAPTFRSAITFKNKQYHLGCYKTTEEAHRAYLRAARKFFGCFARG